jgi:DNA repair exonuclease SbcCD ATPase subunit
MFALMTIQKMTQDTEQARAELETERERNRTRIQELEFERDRSVAEAEKAIAGRMESEKHTAVLRRALEGLERKLLEEKAATDVGLRQLEAERSQVESRIRALEQELEASQRRPRAERETAEARIRQLEAEREELASKLAAREREAPAPAQGKNRQSAARQNTEQVRLTGLELEKQKAVVETLRAELAEARAAAKAAEAAAAAVASPAPGSQPGEAPRHPDPLPHTPIEEFYERAVTRLTVVLASAELLAMSPRLEASLRETAEEIKIQGQALLEIIRKFALPPKPKPPEAG